MAECRFFGECRLAGGLSPRICHGNGTITTLSACGYVNGKCGRFSPMPDRDALLGLAEEMQGYADAAASADGYPYVNAGELWAYADKIREACGKAKA